MREALETGLFSFHPRAIKRDADRRSETEEKRASSQEERRQLKERPFKPGRRQRAILDQLATGPKTTRELAAGEVTPQAIANAMEGLRAAGFVEFTQAKTKSSHQSYRLTEAGAAFLAA